MSYKWTRVKPHTPTSYCAAAACASVLLLEARLPHSNYFHIHIVFIPIHALRFYFFHPRLSSSLYSVQTSQPNCLSTNKLLMSTGASAHGDDVSHPRMHEHDA